MPEANSLSARLKWLREFKQMTLRAFADRVGCDPGYLSKLESGKASNPSDTFLTSVFLNFRVAPKWLRTGEGHPFGGDAAAVDRGTLDALPGWSPERLGRIMAVLNDLPDALGTDIVLVELLRGKTLTQMQNVWRRLRATCYSRMSVPGRLFWNDAFMLLQFQMPPPRASEKKMLPDITEAGNIAPVKSPMVDLLGRLNKATSQRGKKSELAKHMGVPLPNVSQWLSGDRAPGGETTLRLLAWVQAQEAKQKDPGRVSPRPEPKTRVHSPKVYEKQTQVRKKS